MKTFMAAAVATSVLTGVALASAAQAAPLGHRMSPYERAQIAKSERHLNVLKRQVRADGKVTAWERARIRAAQAKHDALVWRYRHT